MRCVPLRRTRRVASSANPTISRPAASGSRGPCPPGASRTGGLAATEAAADTITDPVILGWIAQWKGNVPAVLKAMLPLVAPGATLPVSQAPVSDVDVWVTPASLVHVTRSPAVTRIGFGLKQAIAGGQFSIRADEVAAAAGRGVASVPSMTTAEASSSRRIDLATGWGYALFSLSRIVSCSRPLLATAFPPA